MTTAAEPAARRLTAADLSPGPGVTAGGPGEWAVADAQARLTAAGPLAAGWYRVRLAVRSGGRFTVHKRAELVFDPADGDPRPVGRETFGWNRGFDERVVVRLPRPAGRVRVDLHRAEGPLAVDAFEVTPLSDGRALAVAAREKLRLIVAYRCAGRVLARGGAMLATGRWAEFRAKVLKGLVDSREMRFGQAKGDEADAAWWRRHALTKDEADRVAEACEALVDPPPLAVVLAADPGRLDLARLAAHSVRRQVYPHWQLVVAAAGPSGLTRHLEALIDPDPRVSVVRVPRFAGLATAVAKAVGGVDCDRLVVLPPGVELAEHALYHLAAAVVADRAVGPVGGKVSGAWDAAAGPGRDRPDRLRQQAAADRDDDEGDRLAVPPAVWLVPTKTAAAAVPRRLKWADVGAWASGLGADPAAALPPVLAFPIQDRPLIDRARVGRKPTPEAAPLYLAAHLAGISGYDHLVFAVLQGLPSVGAEVRLHPSGAVRADLVPPALMPRPGNDFRPGRPELWVCPPWVAARAVGRGHLGPRAAVFTMWESDALAADWVAALNRARVVVVPSRWAVDCFRASGVTAPLAVAPLGFDPLVFHPADVPPPAVCTFGTAGALAAGGLRKNAQRVIDLFRAAFPAEPGVRLRVKITPNSPAVETYDDPRVDVIRAVLPHGQLADWYRSLTAYVNLSAGEGFGLHLIEAMACGRPLVTPDYSGLTAFFDPSVGYPVGYSLVPVRNAVYAGRWCDPDDADVVAALRRIHADPAAAARLGEAAATRATAFTWKAAGRALAAALREHGFLGERPA